MTDYDRPTAPSPEPRKVRVSFWATCEIPDPDHEGRYVVKHSPAFPLETDLRAWAGLHIARGEIRMYRREIKPGTTRDIELDLMEVR